MTNNGNLPKPFFKALKKYNTTKLVTTQIAEVTFFKTNCEPKSLLDLGHNR